MRDDPINTNYIKKSRSNEIEGLELTHQGGGAYGQLPSLRRKQRRKTLEWAPVHMATVRGNGVTGIFVFTKRQDGEEIKNPAAAILDMQQVLRADP